MGKIKQLAFVPVVLVSSLFSLSVVADECEIDLQHDVRIENQHIQVMDGEQTLYQIDQDNQIWIGGAKVDIEDDIQADVEAYAKGLRDEMPKLVETVNNAILLAVETLEKVSVELLNGSDFSQDLGEVLQGIKEKLNQHFYHDDDVTFVAHSINSWMDDEFDADLEKAMEEIVAKLTGQILSEIGIALMSGEDTFEERMKAFAEDIERKTEALEDSVESRAEILEKNAETHCDQFERLGELELKMRKAIPELKDSELFKI